MQTIPDNIKMSCNKYILVILNIFVSFILFLALACNSGSGGKGNGNVITVTEVGNVEGIVTLDTTSTGLFGVNVVIGDKTDETDSMGKYLLTSIAVGKRIITAKKSGYKDYTNTIEITKETIIHNIQMTKDDNSNLLPLPPTEIIAIPEDSKITVTWTGSSKATSYNIYWATTPGVNKITGTKVENILSPFIHNDLTNGTSYYYIITGINKYGEGKESIEVSATPSVSPNPPTGITADPLYKQVTIAWDSSKSATSYNIYWLNTGEVTKKTGKIISNIINSPYTHTNLTNGIFYYYIITAVNNYGESIESEQVSAKPEDPPPSPIEVLATPYDKKIILTWDNIISAVSYNIYWSSIAGVTKENGIKITDASSPYIHPDLNNDTTYYYILTSVNKFGESIESKQVSAIPSPSPVPPSQISAVGTDKQMTITWNTVDGADSYNIYWSTNSGVTKKSGAKIEKAVSPYKHTGLINDTVYFYVVTAVNKFGEGIESKEISGTPGPPPGVPTGVKASPADKKITITWNGVTNAASYNIYWAVTGGVTKINGTKIVNVKSPYIHLDLINGTTYFYIITAENKYGEGNASSQVSAIPENPPSPPQGVKASGGDKQAILSWDSSIGATSYNIYWSKKTGVSKTNGVIIGNIIKSPYTHTGLTNDTTYYYIVTAVSSFGESAESNEAFAVPGTPPEAPTNVAASGSDKQTTITWNPSPKATSYNVYWSKTPGVTKSNGTKLTYKTSPFTHTGLDNDVTYYYIVTAVNTYGEGNDSNQVFATTGTPPTPPTGVTASYNDANKQTSITWNSSPKAVYYNLYWATTQGVTKSNGTKIENAVSPYKHNNPTYGITYYYVVTGVNSYGEGAESQEASVKPLAPIPTLSIFPESFDFGNSKIDDYLNINNIGEGTLSWSISDNAAWLTISSSTDTTTTTETDLRMVTIDRTGLVRGSYSGEINITSNGGDKTIPVSMSIPNRNPSFTTSPLTIGTKNILYSYDVDAADLDLDSLTYSLTQSPTGMTIDSNGLISWTPTASGMYPVNVLVTDGYGGEANQNYSIEVATYVSGAISDHTVWDSANSPYVVTDDININNGATLTINPGTTIKFDENKSMQVDGMLEALGTDINKITFTTSSIGKYWGYIYFTDISTDATYISDNYVSGSKLENCLIEYSGGQTISNNGAVRLNKAHPYINYCNIRRNKSSGIRAWNLSDNLKINNTRISYNSTSLAGGGIFAEEGENESCTVTLSNNIIEYNSTYLQGGGIYINGGTVNVSKNIIKNNRANAYAAGINIFDGNVNISNNIIDSNSANFSGGGIFISAGEITILNNNIINNRANILSSAVYYGAALSNKDFKYNLIYNNTSASSAIDLWSHPLINYNSIYNNNGSALDNHNSTSSGSIEGTYNWWGTFGVTYSQWGEPIPVYEQVRGRIYDGEDNGLRSTVNFFPYFETTNCIDAPIIQPINLTANPVSNSIAVSWSISNSKASIDLAGYKVYWDTDSGHPYTNSYDVGNITTYNITGLSSGTYYVTVTAYDSSASGVTDDPNTIINEIQTSGNESWYATEKSVDIQ
ncbi:MAG: fibronectin type III domain-containing protein [Candidatus Firestonebacteria bacterium]|nr:fibronectin type III domain-containing protein [Candidatus Firestonebacteria bacterium]